MSSSSHHYTPEQIAATRQWVENWKRVGPILEKIRHEELRAMTDEESWQTLDALAAFALGLPGQQNPRTTSGFVEQQRRFKNARKT